MPDHGSQAQKETAEKQLVVTSTRSYCLVHKRPILSPLCSICSRISPTTLFVATTSASNVPYRSEQCNTMYGLWAHNRHKRFNRDSSPLNLWCSDTHAEEWNTAGMRLRLHQYRSDVLHTRLSQSSLSESTSQWLDAVEHLLSKGCCHAALLLAE